MRRDARRNVAGHRAVWCSAAPAQRYYSTPQRCAAYTRGALARAVAGDEGTMGRTISLPRGGRRGDQAAHGPTTQSRAFWAGAELTSNGGGHGGWDDGHSPEHLCSLPQPARRTYSVVSPPFRRFRGGARRATAWRPSLVAALPSRVFRERHLPAHEGRGRSAGRRLLGRAIGGAHARCRQGRRRRLVYKLLDLESDDVPPAAPRSRPRGLRRLAGNPGGRGPWPPRRWWPPAWSGT